LGMRGVACSACIEGVFVALSFVLLILLIMQAG